MKIDLDLLRRCPSAAASEEGSEERGWIFIGQSLELVRLVEAHGPEVIVFKRFEE